MLWTGGIAAFGFRIVDGKRGKEGGNGRRTRIYSAEWLARAFMSLADEASEDKLTMIAQVRENGENGENEG